MTKSTLRIRTHRTRPERSRRLVRGVLGSSLSLLLAAAAGAEAGAGVLEDCSFDDRTVTVGTVTLQVQNTTQFRTSTGEELSLLDVEDDWIGERASYRSIGSYPLPSLELLVLDDPDADEVD